jgi:hypothetical protein
MKGNQRLPVVLGALLVAGCASGAQPDGGARTAERSTAMQDQTRDLARKLTSRAYGEFFVLPDHAQTIDRIWADAANRPVLEALVADAAQPLAARFLAAEVLFARDFAFTARVSATLVADIYAGALEHNLTGMANSWGLLYEHDDAGPVGIRFVMLGEAAVPALLRLLGNASAPLIYDGSKEATVGNAYHYRVKDFAAFYLGRIRRIPVAFHREPAERDQEIARLAQQVAARPASASKAP